MIFEKGYRYLVMDQTACRIPISCHDISPNGQYAFIEVGFMSNSRIQWTTRTDNRFELLDILDEPI